MLFLLINHVLINRTIRCVILFPSKPPLPTQFLSPFKHPLVSSFIQPCAGGNHPTHLVVYDSFMLKITFWFDNVEFTSLQYRLSSIYHSSPEYILPMNIDSFLHFHIHYIHIANLYFQASSSPMSLSSEYSKCQNSAGRRLTC